MPTSPDRGQPGGPFQQTCADEDSSPFASLESAQEYITLLGSAIEDALKDIETDIDTAASERATRRQEALYLANYKLTQLRQHVTATSRLLNDLRMLRRLLLSERDAKSAPDPMTSTPTAP